MSTRSLHLEEQCDWDESAFFLRQLDATYPWFDCIQQALDDPTDEACDCACLLIELGAPVRPDHLVKLLKTWPRLLLDRVTECLQRYWKVITLLSSEKYEYAVRLLFWKDNTGRAGNCSYEGRELIMREMWTQGLVQTIMHNANRKTDFSNTSSERKILLAVAKAWLTYTCPLSRIDQDSLSSVEASFLDALAVENTKHRAATPFVWACLTHLFVVADALLPTFINQCSAGPSYKTYYMRDNHLIDTIVNKDRSYSQQALIWAIVTLNQQAVQFLLKHRDFRFLEHDTALDAVLSLWSPSRHDKAVLLAIVDILLNSILELTQCVSDAVMQSAVSFLQKDPSILTLVPALRKALQARLPCAVNMTVNKQEARVLFQLAIEQQKVWPISRLSVSRFVQLGMVAEVDELLKLGASATEIQVPPLQKSILNPHHGAWQAQGESLLHMSRIPGVVSALLTAKAPVNIARDMDGYTPLHVWSSKGEHETVRILLAAGADVDAKTSCQRKLSPLSVAKDKTMKQMLRVAAQQKNAQLDIQSHKVHHVPKQQAEKLKATSRVEMTNRAKQLATRPSVTVRVDDTDCVSHQFAAVDEPLWWVHSFV